MDRVKAGMIARRLVVVIAALCVAAVAMHFALRGLDLRTFGQYVRNLDVRWVLLAVVFDIASYVAQGIRWRFLLNGASIWKTTRAVYVGLFLNELIPLRPGEAVRGWLAARDLNRDLWNVAPSMVVERLMDGVWLVAGVLAAVALAPLPQSMLRAAQWLSAGMAALLLLVWLLGRTRVAFLKRLRAGLRDVRALMISGCFLIAQGMAFWAVIRASHLPLSPVAACVVMIVVRLGTMIPGAPANLGTHQISAVLGLSLYGVPQPEAAAFSIVVFTVLTVPLLTIGLIACLNAGVNWRFIRAGALRSPETVSGDA